MLLCVDFTCAIMSTTAFTEPYIPEGLIQVDPEETEGLTLVSCVRYDPVLLEDHPDWHSTNSNGETKSCYLLLPYHVQRLRSAAEAFGWLPAVKSLARDDANEWFQAQCEEALQNAGAVPQPSDTKTAYKVRAFWTDLEYLSIYRAVGPFPTSSFLAASRFIRTRWET